MSHSQWGSGNSSQWKLLEKKSRRAVYQTTKQPCPLKAIKALKWGHKTNSSQLHYWTPHLCPSVSPSVRQSAGLSLWPSMVCPSTTGGLDNYRVIISVSPEWISSQWKWPCKWFSTATMMTWGGVKKRSRPRGCSANYFSICKIHHRSLTRAAAVTRCLELDVRN